VNGIPGGFVSIVGAGPGDPELLTLRAARRLGDADVVLHDALVSPGALALAPHALRVLVGKRSGRKSTPQEAIHRLMIRLAKRGLRVVRLKGGDPFVFGRGGEEALALGRAGVSFEVVPGLSSALAAPALAGIPVTHRGTSSAFTVVAGHSESSFGPVVDSLAPNSLTLVVLMGLGSRAALAARLLARGWKADTPAAILFAASTPEASRWAGRLDSLGDVAVGPERSGPHEPPESPGTIVIGDVVALAAAIAPSESADGESEDLSAATSG
jgi:uroporphyrin-III C-methyltransferase/precorrin-2 dehydrogenase/sirohydrochlorin ferrochelatase